MTARLVLQPGRERSVLRRHPWIFAGSVERLEGRARSGDTVEVFAADGRPLGRAACSPESQIRARMWSLDPAETIDHAFIKRRVAAALARRAQIPALREREALRLINAESDGLPGAVCDRYGGLLVVQFTSAGADKWREAIVDALVAGTGVASVYERSDSEVRALEGLAPRAGPLRGECPAVPLAIREADIQVAIDVIGGHKTGFYLDQHDNRLLLRSLVEGRRVLNCFCYTGGFSLHALAGGAAEVVSVDSSGPALGLARTSLAMNPGLPADRASWLEQDVFTALRELRRAGESFDRIVLDPPKFAPSSAHLKQAARAYKDINLLALRLLAPAGMLMTFSCSGSVSPELFQKIVAGAAADAGVGARVLRRLGPPPDHPVSLAFPEGDYLKGLLLQAD